MTTPPPVPPPVPPPGPPPGPSSTPLPPSTPPPPPPPGAPHRPTAVQRTRVRTPLSRVPSPYGLWIALFSVAIFMAPNLVLLGIAGMDVVETVAIESTGMIVLNLLVGLVLQLVIFGVALLPLLAAGRPWNRVLGPTRTTGAMVLIGLASGVVVAIVAYMLNAIAVLITGSEEPVQQQLLQDALAGGLPLVLVGVLAVIVAPLVEEVIFRGVLFRALADRLNLGVGLVLSSAIFALIHIEVVLSQPAALVGLFTVGLVLAVAFHLTGNIMVPILGHAVFNAISLALTVAVDRLGVEDLLEVAVTLRPWAWIPAV